MQTFAEKAITFYKGLGLSISETLGIEVLNPYNSPETLEIVSQFFHKYYNDYRRRFFVLGINPGRFGSGLTGISFTDPVALRQFCGIENNLGNKRELSSEFIYKLIECYGGVQKFYSTFFMSAICPLGFMKGSKNYNYYDAPVLQEAVTPFIKKTFREQIHLGASNETLIVFGAGKNIRFIEKVNREIPYFKKVIALDHPRFIMQYRRKKLDQYLQQYAAILNELSGA